MPRDRSSLVTFSARADVQAQIDSFFDGNEPVFAVESEGPRRRPSSRLRIRRSTAS